MSNVVPINVQTTFGLKRNVKFPLSYSFTSYMIYTDDMSRGVKSKHFADCKTRLQ